MKNRATTIGILALAGWWLYGKRASTYWRLDPELRSPLLRFRSPGFHRALLPLMRRINAQLPTLSGVQVTRREIPGPLDAPSVTVYIYTPERRHALRPAVLYTHGGGFISGSATTYHENCAHYARELGAVVVSPEYRLAPETPFPGPLEDVYAALKWAKDQAAELDIDPDRIGLAGESAGAGLAACLAQLAHDRAEVPVKFQLLIYPMLDDRTTLQTDWAGRGEFVWTPTSNLLGWASYLGHSPGLAAAPYAAAARREDLQGLPPAWIGTGDLDLFYQEDREYARRLQEAGVPCAFHEVAGAYHGFQFLQPNAHISQDFVRAGLDALRRGLGLI